MNSEIKYRFMEECYKGMKSKDVMEQELFTCEKAEEKFGKDITYFTHNEICDMYTDFQLTNVVTLQRRNGVFKKYTNYCMENNIFDGITVNPYEGFDKSDLDEFLKRSELTEEYMYEYLANTLNPTEKFMIAAAYNGLSGSEMILAKYEHIHNGTLQCYTLDRHFNIIPSRKIRVDNMFLQYAWEANNSNEMRAIQNGKPVVKRKLYGSFLIKETTKVDETMTEKRWDLKENMYSKRWRTILNASSRKINYSSVFKLGIRHVILQQMEMKNCTLQELLTPGFIKKLNNKFGGDRKAEFYEGLMKEH